MADTLMDALLKALLRAESSRLTGIYQKTPGALGEPPHHPEPYVTEEEIRQRVAYELHAQREANLYLDPRDAEIRVRAWLHREQFRRMYPSKTDP